MDKLVKYSTLMACLLIMVSKLTAQSPGLPRPVNDEIIIGVEQPTGEIEEFNITDLITGANKEVEIMDQNGNRINYKYFENKVVLLDFWFLTCPPCIVELPGMELLQKKVKSEDFVLLTFAINGMEEIEEKLFKSRKFDLAIVPNTKLINFQSYPTKALYNKRGELIDLVTYGSISEKSIQRLVDKYYPMIKKELKYIVND